MAVGRRPSLRGADELSSGLERYVSSSASSAGGVGSTSRDQRQASAICPGCGGAFPNLFKHMRRCCPEQLPRSKDAVAVADMRKAVSPDDWLDDAEVRAAARVAIAAVEDPMQRRALELRFGLDRDGLRRSPAEVGQALGGKYSRNGQTAQVLIRSGLNSIPLVADDPTGLEVLYEDGDLLAVSKPPFLRTAPVHRFCGKSLTNKLVGYLKPVGGAPPPYIVHRLDQGTSGVYLCAKTKVAAASLQEQWHGPNCSKEYLAIVNVPDPAPPEISRGEFTVDAPIARTAEVSDDVSRKVDLAGQTATTSFTVLAKGHASALLSCILVESGRTHQIRIHAAHVGLPLVGDGLYGGEVDAGGEGVVDSEGSGRRIGRVALHAWRLRVLHPLTQERLLLEAPLPADMDQCCVAHGIAWPLPRE